MTLQHNNRIRRRGGKEVVREAQAFNLTVMRSREPNEAEIRQRAHEIYLGRNGVPGNPVVDWLQAEVELRARAGFPGARGA